MPTIETLRDIFNTPPSKPPKRRVVFAFKAFRRHPFRGPRAPNPTREMVSRCGIDMAALRREREARRGAPPPADGPADSSSLGQGGRVLATGAEADPAPSIIHCSSFGSDFQRWAEENRRRRRSSSSSQCCGCLWGLWGLSTSAHEQFWGRQPPPPSFTVVVASISPRHSCDCSGTVQSCSPGPGVPCPD